MRKILKNIDKNHKVLFLGSKKSRDLLLEAWTKEDEDKEYEELSIQPKKVETFLVHPESLFRISGELPFLLKEFYLQLKNNNFQNFVFDENLEIKKLFHKFFYSNYESLFQKILRHYEKLNREYPYKKNKNFIKVLRFYLKEKDVEVLLEGAFTFDVPYFLEEENKTIYFRNFLPDLYDLTKPFSSEEKMEVDFQNDKNFMNLYTSQDFWSSKVYSPFFLERKLRDLQKEIEVRLKKQIFSHQKICLPILVFDKNKNYYQKRNLLAPIDKNHVGVGFYSHFLREVYEKEDGSRFIGGIVFLEDVYTMERKKTSSVWKELGDTSIMESLILMKNAFFKNTIIPFLSFYPPQESFLKQMENRGNKIFYIPLREFPSITLEGFQSIWILGNQRIQKMLKRKIL